MFSFPSVKRKVPNASSFESPNEVNTCDGLLLPVEHADPADAHIPYSSSCNSNWVPSTFGNDTLIFPGNLFSRSPFIFISLKFSFNLFIN